MNNNKKTTVKVSGNGPLDFFLNFIAVVSLGWISWSIVNIYFQLVNKYSENITDMFARSYVDTPIRYGIAVLIVITPIYFFTINLLHHKYKKAELSGSSGIARLATYLILLASLVVMAGSLIDLINNFLKGVVGFSVIAKLLIILIVAGVIFGYYFYDLRRQAYEKKSWVSIIAGGLLIILILGGVIIGFLNIEDPETAKNRLIDSNIAEVMSSVSATIVNFYKVNNFLGDNLDIKQLVPVNLSGLVEENVTYRKVSEKEFELCATFKTDAYNSETPFLTDNDYPWIFFKKGLQCYVIDAEKIAEKYYSNNEISVN